MMDATTAAPTTLVLRRTFTASRERLFDAWTDPNVACQFLCPDGVRAVVEMDARVDGAYRIDMHLSNGSIMGVHGVFREIRRPDKLVMTWEEEANDGERNTLLTLEFFERADGTEIVLTHENFSSEQARDGHGYGWGSILRKCESLLESGVAADVDLEDLTAHASVHLAASPDRVFSALVSDEITSWWVRPGLMDTRQFSGDVRVGGTYHASGVGRGQPYAIEGEYLVVDAPHKLVHTWKGSRAPHSPSTVTYTLTPIEGGTRLALRHDGLPNEDVCVNTGKTWETSFAALAQRLGGFQAPPTSENNQ